MLLHRHTARAGPPRSPPAQRDLTQDSRIRPHHWVFVMSETCVGSGNQREMQGDPSQRLPAEDGSEGRSRNSPTREGPSLVGHLQ